MGSQDGWHIHSGVATVESTIAVDHRQLKVSLSHRNRGIEISGHITTSFQPEPPAIVVGTGDSPLLEDVQDQLRPGLCFREIELLK